MTREAGNAVREPSQDERLIRDRDGGGEPRGGRRRAGRTQEAGRPVNREVNAEALEEPNVAPYKVERRANI